MRRDADLDQLLSMRRRRPLFHRRGQSEPAQEIAQVVGERVQPKTRFVVVEAGAG